MAKPSRGIVESRVANGYPIHVPARSVTKRHNDDAVKVGARRKEGQEKKGGWKASASFLLDPDPLFHRRR